MSTPAVVSASFYTNPADPTSGGERTLSKKVFQLTKDLTGTGLIDAVVDHATNRIRCKLDSAANGIALYYRETPKDPNFVFFETSSRPLVDLPVFHKALREGGRVEVFFTVNAVPVRVETPELQRDVMVPFTQGAPASLVVDRACAALQKLTPPLRVDKSVATLRVTKAGRQPVPLLPDDAMPMPMADLVLQLVPAEGLESEFVLSSTSLLKANGPAGLGRPAGAPRAALDERHQASLASIQAAYEALAKLDAEHEELTADKKRLEGDIGKLEKSVEAAKKAEQERRAVREPGSPLNSGGNLPTTQDIARLKVEITELRAVSAYLKRGS